MADRPRLVQAGTLAHRIVVLMRADQRPTWTPSDLARALGTTQATVRKELTRLLDLYRDSAGNPYLVRVHRGIYRVFIDRRRLELLERPPLGVHAIQASCRAPQNRGWGPPPAPTWGALRAGGQWVRDERNGGHELLRDWQGRRARYVVYPSTGTVQVSLQASQQPLPPAEVLSFMHGAQEALGMVGVAFPLDLAQLDNVEVNEDYRAVGLHGVRDVRLRPWLNGALQLYQKDERMRREARVWTDKKHTVIGVPEALAALAPRRPDEAADVPFATRPADGPALPPTPPQPWELI